MPKYDAPLSPILLKTISKVILILNYNVFRLGQLALLTYYAPFSLILLLAIILLINILKFNFLILYSFLFIYYKQFIFIYLLYNYVSVLLIHMFIDCLIFSLINIP